MSRVRSIPVGLQVVFDSEKGLGVQRDSSESLPFTNNVDHSLVPIGLEIPELEVTDFSLS